METATPTLLSFRSSSNNNSSTLTAIVAASVGAGFIIGKNSHLLCGSWLKWMGRGTAHKKMAGKGHPSAKEEVDALIRENILQLAPYRCARDDYSEGILLDANENSLGPPLEDTDELLEDELERYPCPYQVDLKQAIADYRNKETQPTTPITKENIFLGVGSDEAIDLLIRISCTPRQDAVLITPPTYGMYQVCANIHDVELIRVPLVVDRPQSNPQGLLKNGPSPSLHIDVDKILEATTPNTKIVFLCSPGNPTPNALRISDIKKILNAPSYRGFVVVDEAYIDFAEQQSLCTLVTKYPRLVVLQTLSKSFGLAGIRLGCAFATPRLVQLLNNTKAPYNINKLTSKVALKAVRNIVAMQEKVNYIKKERSRVTSRLQKLPFVRCIYASDANFVLFEIPQAFEVYKEMAARGVVIRYRGKERHLKDCVRATIGTEEQNNRMLEVLVQVSMELDQKSTITSA